MCISKTIKIYLNQDTDLVLFLFIEDCLKIKRSGTSFQATFFLKSFDKKLAKFHYQTVFSQVIQ